LKICKLLAKSGIFQHLLLKLVVIYLMQQLQPIFHTHIGIIALIVTLDHGLAIEKFLIILLVDVYLDGDQGIQINA